MSVGPIPWRAIDRYAERIGLLDDEVEYTDFVEIVQALDVAFLGVINKDKSKSEPKKNMVGRGKAKGKKR